ncbi:MAG: purine-nucleoside phosphorylase [Chiayiivirga sp.]|jgi:purine-nucleoside phosphorylase|uniref:Purine nucleoside phosphorylase DeoD-type n=1 Tax=Denitratimonas tolerans TaxID=1338420 RepID=A0AAW9R3L6_9GAMM|nr:purine-nucleoside phosphorylase [Xanthomonadaceae bacterium]MDX9764126.1 purine-nucleoside phosphorylase [Chiayiivirga sp.]MEB2315137.1 purine-nucleoside phosphorylase [Xanthomonadaceae bacterium]HMN33981.1 purine-nucleoside phosphorylase [Chiayiivirga sp.]HRO88609.1 purine-nucleoside phosphorylase [Chiayiivirga sp.]
MSSAHIDAAPGQIADTVLLPGDPLRARFVAQALLADPQQVTARRNMLGFTGTWNGRPVSVMGGGMGIPSTAIYVTELARSYGVRRIIRIGTCGGLGDVAMGEVLLAQSGSTDSRFNRMQFGGHDLAASADFGLLRAAVDSAAEQDLAVRVANVFSTDCFYDGDPQVLDHLRRHHIIGVEMETAGLYGLAMREGFRALAILTVSDLFATGESMPAAEREQGLIRMAKLALACTEPG